VNVFPALCHVILHHESLELVRSLSCLRGFTDLANLVWIEMAERKQPSRRQAGVVLEQVHYR